MAPDFHREVYCLLGLPLDALDMHSVVHRIRQSMRERRPCFLSTPNLNFLIGCQNDADFRNSVIESDLSIADGMPLVWIARLLGIPLPERVAGSTVFEVLGEGGDNPVSVFFFGGPAGVAASACERLNSRASSVTCAGFEYPGFGAVETMSSEDVISRINASNADFLVVSLGAKKGQAWIRRNRARLLPPVVSHLGAVVNFVAGTVTRAPGWVQRSGLEWLWRIKEEPGLWQRYMSDGVALIALLWTRVLPYAWFMRLNRPEPAQLTAAHIETREDAASCVIFLRGAWTRQNAGPVRECFSRSARAGKDIVLDLGAATYIDSVLVALMMFLQRHVIMQGRNFSISSAHPAVCRVLRYCCAEHLLSSSV